MKNKVKLAGRFEVFHKRGGLLIGRYALQNGVTNEGLDKLLDVMFHGTAAIGTWYLGLIDGTGSPALAAADTLASHAGWAEFTDYTGDRKEWTEGAASSQSMTNASSVDFALTNGSEDTVYGLFLCSVATGTGGTLWATAAFAEGVKTVLNGDTFEVVYTINAAAG